MKQINKINKYSTAPTNKGFTLLEVMFALAITGALLVTVLYTLNLHLGVAGRHESVTVSTMLGLQKLAELREDETEESGRFEEPYIDYNYTATSGDSAYMGVRELTVTVTYGPDEVVLRELVMSGTLDDIKGNNP